MLTKNMYASTVYYTEVAYGATSQSLMELSIPLITFLK